MNIKGFRSENDTQTLVISSFYYQYGGNVECNFGNVEESEYKKYLTVKNFCPHAKTKSSISILHHVSVVRQIMDSGDYTNVGFAPNF